jgi:hypothetical protein
MVNPWDAPSAIKSAIRAAGADRHILVADLALRLARLRHVTEVRFNVAPGTPLDAIRLALAEATAEAARRVLAELAPPQAPQAARGETALARAVGAQAEHRGSDALEPLQRRNRTCPECGRDLRQDGRQAKRRVFCSVRCRVRHHRAQVGTPCESGAPLRENPPP